MRLTLSDVSNSRIPDVLGLCRGDFPRLSSYVNQATQELMGVASETGWWGGWDKLVINMPCGESYITFPAEYSRLINIALCRWPIPVFNEFFEVLEAGIGLQDTCHGKYGCGIQAAFERQSVPTAVDLTPGNQYLRVYITDARDINKRIIFLGARDANGVGIYSTDIQHQIQGFPLVFNQPFTTSSFIVTSFTAIVKDETFGDVILKQVDATTGAEVQLSRYTPKQTNPVFRRYYIQGGCPRPSNDTPPVRQVTAMARLEYRPVSEPSDLLLISNIPALKAKVEAIRFSEIDSPQAQAMALLKHRQAVKILSQELASMTGESPAVNLAPFGTARLEKQLIGQLY